MIFGNEQLSLETFNMNLEKPEFVTDMCRVCIMTSEYLKDVVSYELTPQIIDMLNSFANIDVSMNECLPALICDSCYTRLIDANNFKNLCIESNNTLKTYISSTQNSIQKQSQEIQVIPSQSPVPPTPEIIEIENNEIIISEKEPEITESNVEFIKIETIKSTIPEPPSDLLQALGLVKVKRNESTESKNNSLKESPSEHSKSDNQDNINNNKKCKKIYKCKVCGDEKVDYGAYRRHLASHGELPFPCKFCSKKFKTARLLKDHSMNTHSGGRPFSCSQCDSKFATLDDFKVHMRRHAGNTEPHACSICPRRFSSARLLRDHFSIHERKSSHRHKRSATGAGDYACSHCERRFKKKCDVERHERVHTGEKPYVCQICGSRFQQGHNLTKHMVTHTGMKRYTCDICHKTFGRSDVLGRHMFVHEVSKPHSCKVCSRTFARQSQLATHMENNHP